MPSLERLLAAVCSVKFLHGLLASDPATQRIKLAIAERNNSV